MKLGKWFIEFASERNARSEWFLGLQYMSPIFEGDTRILAIGLGWWNLSWEWWR